MKNNKDSAKWIMLTLAILFILLIPAVVAYNFFMQVDEIVLTNDPIIVNTNTVTINTKIQFPDVEVETSCIDDGDCIIKDQTKSVGDCCPAPDCRNWYTDDKYVSVNSKDYYNQRVDIKEDNNCDNVACEELSPVYCPLGEPYGEADCVNNVCVKVIHNTENDVVDNSSIICDGQRDCASDETCFEDVCVKISESLREYAYEKYPQPPCGQDCDGCEISPIFSNKTYPATIGKGDFNLNICKECDSDSSCKPGYKCDPYKCVLDTKIIDSDLLTYENTEIGLSFEYPYVWGEPTIYKIDNTNDQEEYNSGKAVQILFPSNEYKSYVSIQLSSLDFKQIYNKSYNGDLDLSKECLNPGIIENQSYCINKTISEQNTIDRIYFEAPECSPVIVRGSMLNLSTADYAGLRIQQLYFTDGGWDCTASEADWDKTVDSEMNRVVSRSPLTEMEDKNMKDFDLFLGTIKLLD